MGTMIFANAGQVTLRGSQQLYGSAAVEQMQKALQALAQASRSSAVNVSVTGVVDAATITSVLTALSWASSKLPSKAVPPGFGTFLQFATVAAAISPEIKAQLVNMITGAAAAITSAALALAALYGTPASAPPMPPKTTSVTVKLPIMSATLAPGSALAPTGARSAYPAGSISTQAAPGTWRVAVPKGLAGLGDPIGAGSHVEVAPVQSATTPAGTTAVTADQFKAEVSPPWYKDWKIMVPAGAGVLLLGAGAVWLRRRK